MVLKPLEFSDCLTDNPWFRQNIAEHENALEKSYKTIKLLENQCREMMSAAHKLSNTQRNFAKTLHDFKFETIGSTQTDDERMIGNCLKEFAVLINQVEDQRTRILEEAEKNYIEPIRRFRIDRIGNALQDEKKKFEKSSAKFYQSLEKHLHLSTARRIDFKEADAALEMEQRHFYQASLDYVFVLQSVQELMKIDFVETISSFLYSWFTFYHVGHVLHEDFKPYLDNVQKRVQKAKDSFLATQQETEELKSKILNNPVDYCANKSNVKQGYLFLLEKKNLGTTWTKHYCVYQKETRIFTFIPFSQSSKQDCKGAFNQVCHVKLKSCHRRASDSIDKRFCFDIFTDRGSEALTLQALSEDNRKVWLDALDGKEPVYSPSSGLPKNYETTLNDIGFDFIKLCLKAIDDKGLSEQGLYRNCGVTSKVQRLLQIGIDRKQFEKLNLDDDREWEIKTITSSIKTFFRNLPDPLMTFELYSQFVNAAKLDNQQERLEHIHYYVHKLPSDHFKMLKLLVDHLRIVSENSHNNFMTIANLAVCFGPTLMRPKEETVASMMDIKFCNIVVEVLIENNDQIFCSQPVGVCTPKPPKPAHSISEENGSNLSLAQTASVSGYSPSNRSDSHESIGYSTNTGVSNPSYATTIHSKLRPTTVYSSTGELRPNDRSSYDSLTSANSSHAPKSPSPNLSQNCRMAISYAPVYTGDKNRRRPSSSAAQPNFSNMQQGTLSGLNRINNSLQIQPSRRVRTLYECIAEHESELSFLPGQILTNVYSSKEPGWLMGTLNGKTGMVPENYVENLP